MADVAEPPRRPIGSPPAGELDLTVERWTVLAPKLDALLTELRQIEDLEGPDLEPTPSCSWGHDANDR